MNQYNNPVGFHTPALTKQVIEGIKERTGYEATDASWHNDTCDSIEIESLDVQIYIPNTTRECFSEEEFNTFAIGKITGYGSGEVEVYADLDEVINHLNKL